MTTPTGPGLFSIGHSNHPLPKFLGLLRDNTVEAVADIRSVPRSRSSPHFNRPALEAALAKAGIRYEFLLQELGGRPEGDEYYDSEGHVLYGRLAGGASFLAGVRRLVEEAKRSRVAILCSEEDPTGCHRRLLVGRVLATRGVDLLHIRSDGRLQNEADLRLAEKAEPSTDQPGLFAGEADPEWRSRRPVVRPRDRR